MVRGEVRVGAGDAVDDEGGIEIEDLGVEDDVAGGGEVRR